MVMDAKHFFVEEKYDEAIQEYNKVLELFPNDANSYYNLGVIYKK